jgi:hypothetical protein
MLFWSDESDYDKYGPLNFDEESEEEEQQEEDEELEEVDELGAQTGSSDKMQISVTTMSGTTFTLDVKATDTIQEVKIKIQKQEAIPASAQDLLLDDVKLRKGWYQLAGDSSTAKEFMVSDYNIQDGSELTLVVVESRQIVIGIDEHNNELEDATEWLNQTGKLIQIGVPHDATVKKIKWIVQDILRQNLGQVMVCPAFIRGPYRDACLESNEDVFGSHFFWESEPNQVDFVCYWHDDEEVSSDEEEMRRSADWEVNVKVIKTVMVDFLHFYMPPETTASQIKEKIHELIGVEPKDQTLDWDDDVTIEEAGPGETITCLCYHSD